MGNQTSNEEVIDTKTEEVEDKKSLNEDLLLIPQGCDWLRERIQNDINEETLGERRYKLHFRNWKQYEACETIANHIYGHFPDYGVAHNIDLKEEGYLFDVSVHAVPSLGEDLAESVIRMRDDESIEKMLFVGPEQNCSSLVNQLNKIPSPSYLNYINCKASTKRGMCNVMCMLGRL